MIYDGLILYANHVQYSPCLVVVHQVVFQNLAREQFILRVSSMNNKYTLSKRLV